MQRLPFGLRVAVAVTISGTAWLAICVSPFHPMLSALLWAGLTVLCLTLVLIDHRFQFSLRTLFILTGIAAVAALGVAYILRDTFLTGLFFHPLF